LFGLKRIEGKGSMTVSLEGTGASVYALTRTLDGEATLTGTKGALTGLNVEQLLRRLERRPLSGGSEFRSGRTPFDTLAVRMKITQGNVTVEDVNLGGPAVRLALTGEASIPARDLDLKGVATLVSTTASAKPFELPFAVQGAWDDPLLVPDAQILIQRSGAAAPLLEALRARRSPSAQPSNSPAADEETPTPAVIPLSKDASTPPAKASEIKRDRSPAQEREAAAPVGAGASPEPEPAPAATGGAKPAVAPSGKVQ
jgi:AsmA protein